MTEPANTGDKPDMAMFWGCFIALVATSFAFFTRIYLCNIRFPTEFDLNQTEVGALIGAGIWPFAISIILFSLIIDKIGYRVAMLFSFVCYAVYLVMAFMAYSAIQGAEGEAAVAAAQARGYTILYWGSIVCALGNGTVEAFINPLVATMFSKHKTKWLNILHAGWPGGLVIAGILTIALGDVAAEGNWFIVLALIAIPAVVYLVMLLRAKFPRTEREQAGVSYRQMLSEFGAFGALVAFGLIFMQLGEVFAWPMLLVVALTVIVVVAFGVYTRSVGRGIMAFLIIIMMPLATTELGTDGWISGLMEEPMKAAGYNAGWVLVYTSAIMMVLRFFAGPIVHLLSPIGLLIASATLAIIGLVALSQTGGAGLGLIFVAATIYGFGKTFFWPTMLGITSEQCPKGGALTLNAIAGIGMIAVGVLGFPFIGFIQDQTAASRLAATDSAAAEVVLVESSYMKIQYQAINQRRADQVTDETAVAAIEEAQKAGQFDALAKIAIFPGFMLACYIALFLYFKARGGYKPVDIIDEKYTGGVAGPADK
ncbi:MFS transporter [soil metagenome]